MERCEVFPARCPVANTCQALPGGDLWLHKASVTPGRRPSNCHEILCCPPRLSREAAKNQGGLGRKPRPLPGSNSFPVETLLTHSYVFNIQSSCCQFDVFDVAIIGCCCCCFFTHYKQKKEQVLFCKICATASEVF